MLNLKYAGKKELEALHAAIAFTTIIGMDLPTETIIDINNKYQEEWLKIANKITLEKIRRKNNAIKNYKGFKEGEEYGELSGDNIDTGVSDPDNSSTDVLHK